MERYRVVSRPAKSQWRTYQDWLVAHAAEVVLAGGFAGGEVSDTGEALVSDYLAPTEAVRERYVAEQAPALRQEAERLYPQVDRSRDLHPVVGRVSPAFAWESLGLRDSWGRPLPAPADGIFDLYYVAPWCEDSRAAIRDIAEAMVGFAGRSIVAGVYTGREEMAEWMSNVAPIPWAFEPSTKSDIDRVRTFHAFLRQLSADDRTWGLPTRYRVRIAAGRFVVSWP